MTKVSAEDAISNKESIVRLINFVKKHTEVIPVKPEFAEFLLRREDDETIFVGDVSNYSILVGKSTNTALLCDELALAKFAREKYDIPSFWSQSLLADMKERKLISDSKYADICCKLLAANYYFTAINYEVINTILLEDGFQNSKRFEHLMLGLQGPDVLENDAIGIITLVIRFLYFKSPTREQKRFVLDKLLRTLVIGRIKTRVLVKLKIYVNNEFNLAPVQANEFNSDLDSWYKVNQRPDDLFWLPKL
jgi:hypothetical protein